MRIHPILFGILVVGVFLGVIAGFQSAGVWSISGKVTADGQSIQPSASDPNTIKGWMTLGQVATTYNVSLDELTAQFHLPENTAPTTAIKDLESDTFDTTLLKDWLVNRLEAQQKQILDPVATSSQPATGLEPASTPTPTTEQPVLSTAPAENGHTITGKTTFQDLLDWGLSDEAIHNLLGADLPDGTMTIKDYATAKGVEFSTLKDQFQAEVEKESR